MKPSNTPASAQVLCVRESGFLLGDPAKEALPRATLTERLFAKRVPQAVKISIAEKTALCDCNVSLNGHRARKYQRQPGKCHGFPWHVTGWRSTRSGARFLVRQRREDEEALLGEGLNPPKLAFLRVPTAMQKPQFDRTIQRPTIDGRLAVRDDPRRHYR